MQKTAWENIDNYEHDVRKSDGKFFSSTTVYVSIDTYIFEFEKKLTM